MVGIGGCGMSGLARLLRSGGAHVVGCDATLTSLTANLTAEGISVEQEAADLTLNDDRDLLVISAAVKPEHPLVREATIRGLPIMTYAEALGTAMSGCSGLAIAGTHGKSTTTAMLGCALIDAGLDPSVIVGATCSQLAHGCFAPPCAEGVGSRVGAATVPFGTLAGERGLLVAEACEFNRSFHNLHPIIASISSIEADHLDIYGSIDAIIEAFADFARLIPPAREGGRLLIAFDGAHREIVTRGLACAVETIGQDPRADWRVHYDPSARRVRLEHGSLAASWINHMPGEHNATNAATAAALAISLGAAPARVEQSLGRFAGLDRRLQLLGDAHAPGGGTVRVFDDYGHHPTEVAATLQALRESERPADRGGRLICVFQPHQHSRTRFLLDEFASSFSQADLVIVPDIYFVRDSQAEQQRVSSQDLVARLRSQNVEAMHINAFDAIVEHLCHTVRPGDLIVSMGAGPVWRVGRGLVEALGRADAP
jgi:UDP-N-acetylmuramate--alanine ligase